MSSSVDSSMYSSESCKGGGYCQSMIDIGEQAAVCKKKWERRHIGGARDKSAVEDNRRRLLGLYLWQTDSACEHSTVIPSASGAAVEQGRSK